MRKSIAVVAFISVIGGALAGSNRTDADILTRVGRTTAAKVKAVMPDTSALAGPLVALAPPDLMPVADRVRVRIKTDKLMDGATVGASATADGKVTLTGEVKSADQRLRAVELAQSTAGVTSVENKITEPVK